MRPEISDVSGVDPFSLGLRVLHVYQPVEAGVPRYANAAAEFQAARGWTVHMANPEPVGSLDVQEHQWRATRNPLKGVRSESQALAQLLKDIQPDVIVAHSAKAGMIVRGTVRGRIPTVFVPHAWSHLALPGPAKPVAIAWERLAARWTNAVVAVGAAEASEGVRRHVRAPMFLVRNPVPPRWHFATTQDRSIAREALDLPQGAPIVTCVGRFSRQKGQDSLIDAWRLVSKELPEARLLLVGDGPTGDDLRKGAPDTVIFTGATDDPRPFLAACDVAALPSRWEGLSLSMLEAMASGRSVVTTAVAGSEVVADSDCGAVVPVDEPQAFARALLPRLSGLIEADVEGRRGHQYVIDHHDFDTQMARFAAVISRAHAFGR